MPLQSGAAIVVALAAVLGSGLGSGCAAVQVESIVPTTVEVEQHHAGTVRVDASGSPRRAAIGPRRVGAEPLAAAVRSAVLDSGVFAGVVEEGPADHVLRVAAVNAETSEPQLDMTARTSMRWTLLDSDGRVARWERMITTTGKASTFDARMVEERTRMALESSVRANVAEGIRRLGALDLTSK